MKIKQSEISEVIQNLNNGVQYSNEVGGWSYSKGNVMMKITANGKIVFYQTIEKFATAIIKSMNTGI